MWRRMPSIISRNHQPAIAAHAMAGNPIRVGSPRTASRANRATVMTTSGVRNWKEPLPGWKMPLGTLLKLLYRLDSTTSMPSSRNTTQCSRAVRSHWTKT